MSHEFDHSGSVHIHRDRHGVARDLLHIEEPYLSDAATPQLAARDYLQKYGHLLGIEHAQLDHLGLSPEAAPIAAPVEYRFQDEKVQFDTTALVFAQTCLDLPIREATGARGGGVPVTRSPCVGVTASRTTPKGATAAGSPSRDR